MLTLHHNLCLIIKWLRHFHYHEHKSTLFWIVYSLLRYRVLFFGLCTRIEFCTCAISHVVQISGIMESNLLQTFWYLSSIEESERIEAAKNLVLILEQHQVSIYPV